MRLTVPQGVGRGNHPGRGNRHPGDTGDDGLATGAQLHEPAGMAATPDGGFLIADVLNNEVPKLSAD